MPSLRSRLPVLCGGVDPPCYPFLDQNRSKPERRTDRRPLLPPRGTPHSTFTARGNFGIFVAHSLHRLGNNNVELEPIGAKDNCIAKSFD
jgi:hypothetical protein